MKAKENNLEENIKKALRKAKKQLEGYSWDWHATIAVYDNGAVTMCRNTNAGANGEQIYKFGDHDSAEIAETFKVRDHQEIKVNEDCEHILDMLDVPVNGSLENKPSIIAKLEQNLTDALELSKHELKDLPSDFYAVINAYDNGSVYMYMKGIIPTMHPVHQFGKQSFSELVQSFEVGKDKNREYDCEKLAQEFSKEFQELYTEQEENLKLHHLNKKVPKEEAIEDFLNEILDSNEELEKYIEFFSEQLLMNKSQ